MQMQQNYLMHFCFSVCKHTQQSLQNPLGSATARPTAIAFVTNHAHCLAARSAQAINNRF
jgi:hypothetical protein